MKMYVARHGETTWNAEKRVMGTLPGELSEKGQSEARQLGISLQNLPIDIGFVSDLNRAVQTADAVTELNPSISFTQTPALRERHYGDFEGKLFSEFNWDDIWGQPDDATPFNCESLNAFTDRVASFMKEIAQYSGSTVLLVTHEGTMNRLAFLSNPSNSQPQKFPNATIVEFDYESILRNAELYLAGEINKLNKASDSTKSTNFH